MKSKKAINQEIRKIIKDNTTINANGCWIWQRVVGSGGYGAFTLTAKPEYMREYLREKGFDNTYVIQAHRVSNSIFNRGTTKANPLALHKCNNPMCANPEHIYSGTYRDNAKDVTDSGTRRNLQKYSNRQPERLADIKIRLARGESLYSVAKLYSRYPSTISGIAKVMSKSRYMPQLRGKQTFGPND